MLLLLSESFQLYSEFDLHSGIRQDVKKPMNQPIVLLNMLSKLIEKVIGERMQFHTIFNNFIHPYQFREFKQ